MFHENKMLIALAAVLGELAMTINLQLLFVLHIAYCSLHCITHWMYYSLPLLSVVAARSGQVSSPARHGARADETSQANGATRKTA